MATNPQSGNSNSIPILKPTELSPNLIDRARVALEFPRFSGENPRSWFRKCERYFMFCPTAEHEKVFLASMYMEGKAEFFYMDYVAGKGDIGWERFSEMVFDRFDDPCGESVVGAFKNLQQEGSVEMYVEKFEEVKGFMAQRYRTFTEEYFVTCFVSGLKEEIGNMVKMFSPATLIRAFELARIQEMRLEHMVKELIQEGEPCLNCDEPDSDGHMCKRLYKEEVDEDSRAAIYSLIVPNNPSNIVLKGAVKKGSIAIKLVPESTHSFLDLRTARRVGFGLECTNPFLVTLGDGRETQCNFRCRVFEWQMGGITFSADVRIMRLGGFECDLVLGMDFLREMGDIGFNYSKQRITIRHEGKEVVLQGKSR